MKSNKNLILRGSLLAGSIISLGAIQANANDLIRVENLGSGGEVRSTLLASERMIDNAIELSCGEKSESKAEEAKCGEGKCGEAKKEAKSSKKAKKESKAEEHKCGEGKCGEAKKKEAKKESKKESKAEEHKCGEGKCGM